MRTIIKSRIYKAGNILVSLTLWEVFSGRNNHLYEIKETFRGSRSRNDLLRGVYNDEGVARVDFKNMLNNIERTIPIAEMV
jgi:hypothetical protein